LRRTTTGTLPDVGAISGDLPLRDPSEKCRPAFHGPIFALAVSTDDIVATKKRPQPSDENTPPLQSETHGATDVFDVRRVRQLIELMREYDLSLVELKQGDQRVRLRRGGEPAVVAAPVAAASSGQPLAHSPAAPAPGKAADALASSPGNKTVLIKSPMVGTFYSSPKPDAPPYVKVGDMIGPDTVVCIIEAMKVFNELPAEISGRIVVVLAESGTPVEYGQALFEVEPK
jgi:acetyl-CoA carboxylase biotin carboxyl carrier protein